MIPVIQNKFRKKIEYNGQWIQQYGNCLASCIASIMELPLSEVPNIETLFEIEEDFYLDVLQRWLQNKGLEYSTGDEYKIFHPEFMSIKDFGSDRNTFEERDEMRKMWCEAMVHEQGLENHYYLVSGISPRSKKDSTTRHITIWQNGKMVHDPHESREGIVWNIKDLIFTQLRKII